MNCNYKVNIKDIQNKYKFNIFAMGGYNDSDLRKMIESVFYALPRTTASGTSVTLNDTARSYMHNELNATDTSQNTTTGKNLLQLKSTAKANITTNDNTTFTYIPTANGNNDYLINGEANTSYTFKANVSASSSADMYVYFLYSDNTDESAGYISGSGTQSKTITKTSNASKTLIGISIRCYDIANKNNYTFNEPMLEKGTSATAYEPYTNGASPNPDYPQVIHTITGDNEVIVSGKNKFNVNDFESQLVSGKILNDSGVEINDSGSTYSKYMIYLKANTTYHLKGYWQRIYYYNENKVFKSRSTSTNTLRDSDYTPTENEYIEFQINNATWSANKGQEQIELGNGSTYEPYKSNSVLLTLGDKEICKIGDYEDKIFKAIKGNEIYDSLASEEKSTLDYGKWYLRKNIGKVVLDENTTILSTPDYINIGRFNTTGYTNIKRGSANNPNAISSHFKSKYETANGNIYVSGVANEVCLIYTDYANNLAGFKTWLGTNKPIVYYLFAIPVNELFNDTIQDQLEDIYNNMLSYEGQTNVSQVNDDLPFNINSTAIKDLNDL